MENKQNVVSILDVSAVSLQRPQSASVLQELDQGLTQRDIFRLSCLGLGNIKLRVCILVKDSQGWSQRV